MWEKIKNSGISRGIKKHIKIIALIFLMVEVYIMFIINPHNEYSTSIKLSIAICGSIAIDFLLLGIIVAISITYNITKSVAYGICKGLKFIKEKCKKEKDAFKAIGGFLFMIILVATGICVVFAVGWVLDQIKDILAVIFCIILYLIIIILYIYLLCHNYKYFREKHSIFGSSMLSFFRSTFIFCIIGGVLHFIGKCAPDFDTTEYPGRLKMEHRR